MSCTASQYNTLRVGLIRKFKISSDACAAIGDDSMTLQYVSCTFNQSSRVAEFALKDKSDKKRKPVDYNVL